ncbi:MAG: TolC family protein [Leadbetterella sp.]|nr:TolC family protein [Leadbetterella sp.]
MKYLHMLLFLMIAKGVTAQSGSSFTLRDCIEYALQNNITIRQSEAAVENSDNLLNQSKAQRLPSVTGFMSGNGNTGRNVDPFTNGIVTQTIGTNNMGVGLNLPVYQGNRLKNAVERDKLSLEATMTDVQTQKNNIALQVAVAYLNVLSAEDLIEVSQKQLEVTRLQYDRTRKLIDGGALPETNLFDLDAQKANDELALVNAENSRESAFLALKRTMNAPLEMMFSVVKSEVPDPQMLAQEASSSSIYQTALSFLPEVRAGKIRMNAADRNIAIARSLGHPTISLSTNWGTAYSSVAKRAGTITTSSRQIPISAEFQGQTVPVTINWPETSYTMENIPYFNQLGNNQNLSFGLSLNVPIFNRFNTKYQTQAAQIQKKQVDLQNKATEIQIKQNIDQAYIDMLNARKKYSATLAQAEALNKAFVAAEKRYNAGAGTFVDYNLAKTNLDRANTNLVIAKYDYIFRTKVLDFYQNKPLEF